MPETSCSSCQIRCAATLCETRSSLTSSALAGVGDQYRAPDGVLYSLLEEPTHDPTPDEGTLSRVSSETPEPIVEEVLRFEDLPPGSSGTRRAIVRWSDGTESEAMTWYADEILICEGDLIAKTRDELRSLHFRLGLATLES